MHVLQAGVAAVAEGKTQDATGLFDSALDSIEGMFANTENAAKARSLWYEEGAKDYKGEPYERAMAYYYRGLLYLAEGDYENARASFRGGILQDAFADQLEPQRQQRIGHGRQQRQPERGDDQRRLVSITQLAQTPHRRERRRKRVQRGRLTRGRHRSSLPPRRRRTAGGQQRSGPIRR
jgi:tetratricopeptide (TPR) repeat protein